MPRLAVGLLNVNKNIFGAYDGGLDGRIDNFRTSVQQADAVLDGMLHGQHGVRMLVAPEYYWSDYADVGRNWLTWTAFPMRRSEKHDIYDGLRAISAEAGDLVLVAGSIFYRKGGGNQKTSLNVCPVLYNGQFLLKNYKQYEDGYAEVHPMDYRYKTTHGDPVFEVDGIEFGVDVCGDHLFGPHGEYIGGRLRRWSDDNGGRTVDVHILISDGSDPQPVEVRANEYVLYCDFRNINTSTGVYPATEDVSNPDNRIRATQVGLPQVNGAVCYYYLLQW